MVLEAIVGGAAGLVGPVMKFLDRRGERRAARDRDMLLADQGLLEVWTKNRIASLEHDTASAAKVEWEGWAGRFVLVARSMVRPGAFYAVTGLFTVVILGNLFWNWTIDAGLLEMLHETLGMTLSFYFTGRNSERLLGVA